MITAVIQLRNEPMPELTNESKLLIQKYMLRLVAVPAALLMVVSFLLGFFINRVAQKEAELAMQKSLNEFQSLVDQAQLDVKTSQIELKKLNEHSKKQIPEIQSKLSKLQSNLDSEQNNLTNVARDVVDVSGLAKKLRNELTNLFEGDAKPEDITEFLELFNKHAAKIELAGRLDKLENQLNVTVSDVYEKATKSGIRIHCGETPINSDTSQMYGDDGKSLNVRIRLPTESNFSTQPLILTSLTGNAGHFIVDGATSIYNRSEGAFTVYLRHTGPISPAEANKLGWRITWIAIGR